MGKDQAIIQFSNVQVGQYNDDVGCEARTPLPIKYEAIGPQGSSLQQPFGVHFLATSSPKMQVPVYEKSWVTNVRKAVVNLLRIAPLRESMGGVEGPHSSPIHSLYEDTIFGTCESIYSTQMVPHSSPSLYRVIRSINFENCTDNVILQKTQMSDTNGGQGGQGGEGGQCGKGCDCGQGCNCHDCGQGGQCGQGARTEQVGIARTSVGTFFLKGAPGSFSFYNASVEGYTKLSPYGANTQTLQTITNQTLVYFSTHGNTPAPSNLPGNIKPINSWMFEVNSPYARPSSGERQWVNYKNHGGDTPLVPESVFAGLERSNSDISAISDIIEHNIIKATSILHDPPTTVQPQPSPFDSETGQSAALVLQASTLLGTLDKVQLRTLFSKLVDEHGMHQVRRALFIDALAAAGSAQAVEVFLEKLQTKEIDPIRGASGFITLPNNLQDPAAIEPLFNYLKNLDLEKNPYLASYAFVNFATIVNRQCVNPKLKNATIPAAVMGSRQCDLSYARDTVLRFFEEKLKSAPSSWMKAMLCQTIGNLGLEESVDTLRKVVKGEIDSSAQVRNVAIYVLASRHQPKRSRAQILSLLLDVSEDLTESSRVRQAAHVVMLSWQPPRNWWTRVAAATWRETSPDMVSFIASSIHSAARMEGSRNTEQRKFAKSAEQIMKKVPMSFKRSYNFNVSTYDPELQVRTAMDLVWLVSNSMTKEAYFSLNQWFSEVFVDIMEVALISGDSPRSQGRSSPREGARNFAEKLLESITGSGEGHAYARFLNNMQVFIPFAPKEGLNIIEDFARKLLELLIVPIHIDVTKYATLIDSYGFVATGLGLPLHYKVSASVIGFSGTRAIEQGKELDHHIKAASKFMCRAEVMAPWSSKRIIAGVDNEKLVNLPINGKININGNQLTLSAHFNTENKFTLAHAHTVPFTGVKSLQPVKDLTGASQRDIWKVILVDPSRTPVFQYHNSSMSSMTGLQTEFSWQGDIDTQFKISSAYEFLTHPDRLLTWIINSPDVRMYKTSFNVDPKASETKRAAFDVQLIIPGWATSSPSSYDNSVPTPSQSSQSHSGSHGTSDSKIRKTLKDKLAKLHPTVTMVAKANLFGSIVHRYYLKAMHMEANRVTPIKEQFFFVEATHDKISQHEEKDESVVASFSTAYPYITTLDHLRRFLKERPIAVFEGHIEMQSDNEPKTKATSLLGQAKTSSKRAEILLKNIDDELCSTSSYGGDLGQFYFPAVYDQLNAGLEWEENLPKPFLNLTSKAEVLLQGVFFPKVSINDIDVQNKERMITVKGNRNIGNEKWKVFISCPRRNIFLNDIQVPRMVDGIFPIGNSLPKQ